MNFGVGAIALRRILVAVDATPSSIAVLETAASLAAGLNAELRGIYVEDINLLRLAGLPFARELGWCSATEMHLDYQRMERVLRGRGTHARQAVVSVTTQLKLHGSLQIVRGHVVQELLRAAADVDLLILGRGGAEPGGRIGGVAMRMAREAPCSVLLVTGLVIPHQGPVMSTFGGQAGDERALAMAVRLADILQSRLLVVLPAATQADQARLQNQARGVLGDRSLPVVYHPMKTLELRRYQRLVRDERVGFAVMGAVEEDAGLENWLAALGCSVLLLR